LLDHAFAEIGGEDGAVGWQFLAVGFDDAGRDWAWSAAIVEDGGCFCEREAVVSALDEDADGGCAWTGAEFFVFFGELVPVVAFGCEGDGVSVCSDTSSFFCCCLDLLSWSLKPSDMLLTSASLRIVRL